MSEVRRPIVGGVTDQPSVLQQRRTALIALALALLATGAVVAAAHLDTALGRFSGRTSNEGSWFEAGAVDITIGGGELSIDAADMGAGETISRCILTTYRGSVDDVAIRAYGRLDGGTGLERYLSVTIDLGDGADGDCSDFRPAATEALFRGSLAALGRRHGSWPDGLIVADSFSDGDTSTLRIAIELRSDDRAQGLDSDFRLLMEARP